MGSKTSTSSSSGGGGGSSNNNNNNNQANQIAKQVKKDIKFLRQYNRNFLSLVHEQGGINIADVREIMGDQFKTNEEFFEFVKEYNKKGANRPSTPQFSQVSGIGSVSPH